MKKFILLGPPGSGKGTIAERVTAKYGVPQISTGEIFRKQIANKTPFGVQIEKFVSSGQLVPDEMVVEVVVDILESEYSQKGFMLDGFPRTLAQADSLSKHLGENNHAIDKAFCFFVPREIIFERLAGRRVCKDCGHTYNVNTFPCKVEGVCDDCGGEVIQRKDDEKATVIDRLDVYEELTAPVINYYRDHDLLLEIDGLEDVDVLVDKIGKLILEE